MAVVVNKNTVNLSTANGFYVCPQSNLGVESNTTLALSSTRTITLALGTDTILGVVLVLSVLSSTGAAVSATKSVTVTLKKTTVGPPPVVTTPQVVTLTAAQITNSVVLDASGTWVIPFKFKSGTTAGGYGLAWDDATLTGETMDGSSTYTIEVTQGAGTTDWALCTSNGTAPAYVAVSNTAASLSTTADALIVDEVGAVTVDRTQTFLNVVGTGVTAYGWCGWMCRSTDPTVANVAKLVWQNPASAAYTLTIDGMFLLGSHSGFRAGTAASPITLANQATIIYQTTPTGSGRTAGYSGFLSRTANNNGNFDSRKPSLFLYGQSPTHQYTTLTATANSGATSLSIADDVGSGAVGPWVAGDIVYVGKQDVTSNIGEALTTTLKTIDASYGTGTTLVINALATYNRVRGGRVVRLTNSSGNGYYGVQLKGSTVGTFIDCKLFRNSNFVLSGVYLQDIGFQTEQSMTSLSWSNDDAANRSQWLFENVTQAHRATSGAGRHLLSYINPSPDGIKVTNYQGYRCKCFGFAVGVPLDFLPVFEVSNAWMFEGVNAPTFQISVKYVLSNIWFEHVPTGSVALLPVFSKLSQVSGISFWSCSSGMRGYGGAYATLTNFSADRCITAIDAYSGSTVGFKFINPKFGADPYSAAPANTTDITIQTGILFDAEFSNPQCGVVGGAAGTINVSTTNQTRWVPGSAVTITSEDSADAGITTIDRTLTTEGNFVRCGPSLADTRVRTAGGYSLRFEPKSGTIPLEWTFTAPTGDISTKTIGVSVWVYITSGGYDAGAYIYPTLTVNYDNGTEVSAVAAVTNSTPDDLIGTWQLLSVTFSPTTSYPEIEITIGGATNAASADAYFYIDDLSILLPPGVSLNLGSLDLWASGFPVVPPLATGINAADVWASLTSTFTGAGTVGKLVTDYLNATVSSRLAAADYTAPPSEADILAALKAWAVETGVTYEQAMQAILAAAAGKLSGADGTTVTIDAGGNPGTTRITATVDASGNRSSVTLS